MDKKWLALLVGIVVVAIFVPTFIVPIMQSSVATSSVEAATSYLENRGYVVFTAAQYALLAKEATAYAAVQNANAAVIAAQSAVVAAETASEKVDLFNTADTFLFPADTDYYVLLTASAGAGNWTDWAEIVDNNAVTLSSLFAANAGYISDIYIYQVTAPADTTHIVEIAYGANKTSLTRIMFNGDNLNLAQIKSRRIPAGETVYYRIMTNTAPTEYVSIGFRYFYE